MFNIIGTIIFGAVIGFLAKFFKGAELSVVATVGLGIVGVLIGNLVLQLFSYPLNTPGIDWIRWIVCIVVAMAAIGIYAGTKARK